MARLVSLTTLCMLVTACLPSTTRLAVRAVTPVGAGVDGAVVGARCTPTGNAAELTDADGHARLDIRSGDPLRSCDVVVAKQGLATQEVAVECPGGACRPVEVKIEEAR